ncbi:MAG: hypothetical protein K0B87_06115 [Candidatus Syntrophosphaera sp.]|nr:hypothetical protein [Candidatus Syntrophosphaera sp.]
MKKLVLIALIAMMLIGMLAFTGCKTQQEEVVVETEEVTEDTQATVDSLVENIDAATAEIKDVVNP